MNELAGKLHTPRTMHLLRALWAGYLPTSCSGTTPSAPSRSITIASKSWQHGKKTGAFPGFQFSMTLESLTEILGAESSTSLQGVFHAKCSAARHEAATTRTIFGPRCFGSSKTQEDPSFLPRTSQSGLFNRPPTICEQLDTKPQPFPFPRLTWVRTTFGSDIGLLHTPTTKANYSAASMQKWACCRNYMRAFGKASPEADEYLMGWPAGWSVIEPSETVKSQSAPQSHSSKAAGG